MLAVGPNAPSRGGDDDGATLAVVLLLLLVLPVALGVALRVLDARQRRRDPNLTSADAAYVVPDQAIGVAVATAVVIGVIAAVGASNALLLVAFACGALLAGVAKRKGSSSPQ